MDFSRHFNWVITFSILTVAAFSISSKAESTTALSADKALIAVQSALDARAETITNVSGNKVGAVSQWALNLLVSDGVKAIKEAGDLKVASDLAFDWQINYSDVLTHSQIYSSSVNGGISIMELGDHKPLLQFLANLFDQLELRVGSAMLNSGIIGDIYQMNYALPIVFTPKGTWRQTITNNREWVEYRKHFIPFANVITYYAANIACGQLMEKFGAGKQGKDICGKVSTKLRFVMGRYIAPKISDFVFNKANGIKSSLTITSSDLVYTDAAKLLSDVQVEIKNENGGTL